MYRVIRVPETEKSGRLHSSTISVVVLPKTAFVNHYFFFIYSIILFRTSKLKKAISNTNSCVRKAPVDSTSTRPKVRAVLHTLLVVCQFLFRKIGSSNAINLRLLR